MLDGAVDVLLGFLKNAGLRYWQVCPLGPTGFGDSPYQCFSAFAGNPYLVDLAPLQQLGLLDPEDLHTLRALPADSVDFGQIYALKWPLFFKAHARFRAAPNMALPYGDFDSFCADQAGWLDPYALFMALKDHFGTAPYWEWPDSLRSCQAARKSTLARSKEISLGADAYRFSQYLFFGQWQHVRTRAQELGIQIIGDAPIFVARDSADAWSRPELFQLDRATSRPRTVAGVPPDYFSAEGQLWGNPLYDWAQHKAEGYAWWIARLRANFALCDVVRIDHFRGFDSYWAIPADSPTARNGEWQPGPGLGFFQKIREKLPDCRLIAEDLGELLPSVHTLRQATGLPGMAILQFAFGETAENHYLPHNLRANSVLYPGTHDNDTTLGWYAAASEAARHHARIYFRVDGAAINWDFIRAGYASVSRLFVMPLQDLLGLGSHARFNIPGTPAGNWRWRYAAGQLERLSHESAAYLSELAALYGRT